MEFFPCPHCTISFTDCYFLENHIKTKHQKQYLAMLKSQVSKSKTVYGPTHSCPHCSCMFHTPRQLDIHTRKAHPSALPQKPAPPRKPARPHRVQEKFHTCPQCSRRFKYLGSLLKHCKSLHKMAVVLTDGHISCADCGKSFENCWGLGPHRGYQHFCLSDPFLSQLMGFSYSTFKVGPITLEPTDESIAGVATVLIQLRGASWPLTAPAWGPPWSHYGRTSWSTVVMVM
ncbi:unnamed protein product [Coregonus sp. 'balchen']|nr:unnamed protein product [Coregonus sp. 'balchen']